MKTKTNEFYHKPTRTTYLRYDTNTREYQINSSWCSWLIILLFPLFTFLFFGCSSAPPPTGEINVNRKLAFDRIDLANQTASHGRYDDALKIMDEARRLARSIDDPELRVRTAIGRGDILFSMGDYDNAFKEWEKASEEGDSSDLPVLASLARIYAIRAKLVKLANGTATDTTVEELRAQINSEIAVVKDDEILSAIANITLGLAEKALGNSTEAENAVKKALAIHVKNLMLEEAAYDWYLIASIRSVAGNYDGNEGALEALRESISLDRRVENGFGLASSWEHTGEVYDKLGRTEDARAAWQRAAEIYEAIGLKEQAEKLKEKLESQP